MEFVVVAPQTFFFISFLLILILILYSVFRLENKKSKLKENVSGWGVECGGRNNGGNCDDDGHTVGTVICTSQTPFTLNLPSHRKI